VQAALKHEFAPPGFDDVTAAGLADIADPPAHQAPLGAQVRTRNRRLPTRRHEQRGQHPQGGRLAGAIGSEEAEDLAVAHLEVNTRDGLHGASRARVEGAPERSGADGDVGGRRVNDHEWCPRCDFAISVSGR
jgi:hypothetical protein